MISGSALSYVAFNVFGNFNNYLLGRAMNGIEVMGQKYFFAEAYARATYEFDKRALPYIVQRASSISQKFQIIVSYIKTIRTWVIMIQINLLQNMKHLLIILE
ncbi:MAG: hypothetical protein CM15mV51_1310 [uncultured marine virus]|nr:MAG: hypothetical protein CM15mV51_1310 [uncultured marine virus]